MASSHSIDTEEPSTTTAGEGVLQSVSNGRATLKVNDLLLLICVLFLLLWPWVYLGLFSASGGLRMPDGVAEYVAENAQLVSAFVTFIGTLNRIAATFLFGCAITRYGQEFIANNNEDKAITVFGVSALMAFQHMSVVWGFSDWKALVEKRQRYLLVFLLFAALGGFACIPSGTASLISPSRFSKSQIKELEGWELDFTSQNSDCVSWLRDPMRYPSGWCRQTAYERFEGAATGDTARGFADSAPPVRRQDAPLSQNDCLSERIMLDIFDSGRANIFTSKGHRPLPRLLSTEAGVPVLGSARGVLPMGPNGVPALNHNWTSHSLFINSSAQRGILSYNYTIRQQGLESNITCAYDSTSPIEFEGDASRDGQLRYRGVCGGGQASVSNSSEISSKDPVDNTRNGLAFMACMGDTSQSSEMDGPMYYLYLRGDSDPGYRTFVGNLTCTVSPLRAQNFSATYHSIEKYFTTDIDPTNKPSPAPTNRRTHPALVQSSTHILGELLSWAHRWNSNMIAESVAAVGIKMFDLPQTERNHGYLELYAATIQGVLEYVATYLRLHLMRQSPPQGCWRRVEGSVEYTVMGWSARMTYVQVAFLLPMTIMNLSTLFILVAALRMGDLEYRSNFEPTDTRSLLAASVGGQERAEHDCVDMIKWGDRVRYREDRV